MSVDYYHGAIVTSGEKRFIVCEITEHDTVAAMANKLKQGLSVICPTSKRSHLTGLLKKEGVSTKYRTINHDFCIFRPCEKREFK